MTNTNQPWLISVCAGRWQVSGIKAAKKAGLNVLGLDADPAAIGLGLCDVAVSVDIRDVDRVLRAVHDSKIKPSGAVSLVSEAGMIAAAAVREEFSLPGMSMQTTKNVTNKSRQREIWDNSEIPSPTWTVADNLPDIEKSIFSIIENEKSSVIVKPADSSGSRGISVIDTKDIDLAGFAGERAISASSSGQVVIEKFIKGTEFTVETFGFAQGGHQVLAVTEKRKVSGTSDTVAMELATPDLPAETVERIGKLACSALSALGYNEGPGHTEIIMCEKGDLYLVEAAGRGGGFMVNDGLVPRASGFDISLGSVLQAVGRDVALIAPKKKSAVLRFIPSSPGVINKISGFEDANKLTNVEAGPLVKIGDTMLKANSDGDRLAYILSWGDILAEVRANADRAEKMINIEVGQ